MSQESGKDESRVREDAMRQMASFCTLGILRFYDFQKAFDNVPHKRLVHKVKAHGIGASVLAWIENWPSHRKQRV